MDYGQILVGEKNFHSQLAAVTCRPIPYPTAGVGLGLGLTGKLGRAWVGWCMGWCMGAWGGAWVDGWVMW